MNNEIKHYNHNHGKDGRFTSGSGGSISSFKSHSSNVKDIDGRPLGKEEPVKGKKGLLHEAEKIFFDPDRYQVSSVESDNDYAGYLQYSSNSPALKNKFPHLSQNKNTTGMVFTRHENVKDPTAVLHIKRDKNGQNKIDFLWVHGNKKDITKQVYPYELFDIAHNVFGVKSGNKPGEIPYKPELSEYRDVFTNEKKIHEDYTELFNDKLINDNTNSKGEFEYGLSARKDKNMNKKNFIQHGRGPSKRHKYVKIINGKYIYPEDLIKKGKDFISDTKDAAEIKAKELILKGKKEGRKLLRDSGYADYSGPEGLVKRGKEFISDAKDTADINYKKARLKTKKAGRPVVRKIPRTINEIESRGRKLKRELVRDYNNSKNNRIIKRGAVAPIVKRVDYERRIEQKNGGYNTPKSRLEKHAENIVRINQRNGKVTKRKNANNAVGTIANAARTARRNTVRPNSYGHDRTTNYGKPKMNTASNAAERAFNSMKMPKVRKVKKSKLKEFMSKFEKKKKKGLKIKTNDGDTRILSSTVRYR